MKAAADVVIKLGKEMIPNNGVGLSELIKNSYDADATEVLVILTGAFGKPENSIITIQDNGDGMNQTNWIAALETHINNGGSALATLIQVTDTTNFQIVTVTAVTFVPAPLPPATPYYAISVTTISSTPGANAMQPLMGSSEEFMFSWVLNGPVGITGPTGPDGLLFSKKYIWDVYEPSLNGTQGRAALGKISLNSIGGFVGNLSDIENTIIGLKEPIYPNDPVNIGEYINNGIVVNEQYGNWARPEINNTNYWIYMGQFIQYFYDDGTGNTIWGNFEGAMYSRYNGPFDIDPKPIANIDTSTPQTFVNSMYEWRPDTNSANQATGNSSWNSFVEVNTSDPPTNPEYYRLTQCYYVGCASDDHDGGNRAYRSFMTDCAAGLKNPLQQQLYTNPIKWAKEAPRYGFMINLKDTPVIQGVPFYVDVNFILQIAGTQAEIDLKDDFALFGQINYHPKRDETWATPYIDWQASGGPAVLVEQPTQNLSIVPGGGGAPFNILWRDISNSSEPVPPFRPQYSGDLLYKTSRITPAGAGNVAWLPNGALTTSGYPRDISNGTYNIPIHWRAKCIIPNGDEPGIDWSAQLNMNSKFALNDGNDPVLYAAFTMFNTNPEWGLNTRAFSYNILLQEDLGPTFLTTPNGIPPGGSTNPLYGRGGWASSSGFKANMSITPIL